MKIARPLPVVLLALLTALAPRLPAADAEPAEFAGMVAAHNALRARVGTPALAWSANAAQQAQSWAEQLAREDCALRYNPDPARRERYGENILKGYSAEPYDGYKRSPASVVERWTSEGLYYDHQAQLCSPPQGRQCGQYLQMIWETTQVLGCGRARCARGEIWVCDYTPRGGQEGMKPYGNPPPVSEPLATDEVQGCSADTLMPEASPAPPGFSLPPSIATPVPPRAQ